MLEVMSTILDQNMPIGNNQQRTFRYSPAELLEPLSELTKTIRDLLAKMPAKLADLEEQIVKSPSPSIIGDFAHYELRQRQMQEDLIRADIWREECRRLTERPNSDFELTMNELKWLYAYEKWLQLDPPRQSPIEKNLGLGWA